MSLRPFLKWAGNKYQVITKVKALLPSGKRLIEPFVGSAAVFLNTDYKNYLLAEANNDLVKLYQFLQKEGTAFIDYARQFFVANNNFPDRYYELRHLFNQSNDEYLKAALFIYLNKHCYNGLCRYNASGEYNVPFGRFAKVTFPEEQLNAFHKKAHKVEFVHADFLHTMQQAESGDVLYCDPPYVSLKHTTTFTQYSMGGFPKQQQIDLATEAERLAKRGIPVLISNHDTAFTRDIYRNAEIHSLSVRRSINCKGEKRGKVAELLAVFT